ncbi:MAG: GWxTD domain-containing protein [Candidatus Eisenbacteria bacterium]|nr:GWxTD domain-containing protein [Candidatus Eisenbacteria bacterium]
MRQGLLLAFATLALGAACAHAGDADTALPARGDPARTARAESLYVQAESRLAAGGLDARRKAIAQLEEAALLAPDDARYQTALGDACLDAGFAERARACFERGAMLAPADAAPRFGLGEVWKRDWLSYLRPASLALAIENFSTAARLQPDLSDAWVMLAPLLFEQGHLSDAVAAAERARAAGPDHAEAQLTAAYLAFRQGLIERAESLFMLAIPRLSPELRARFDDITPLVTEEDAQALRDIRPAARDEWKRHFWLQSDPDPTTRTNEARLEYWARLAHASLVFLDPRRPRWDLRAELYARYGAPRRVAYQPPGVPLAGRLGDVDRIFYSALNGPRRVNEPLYYPFHATVWDYPDLRMTVVLQDPTLSEQYRLPKSLYRDPDPHPGPEALARSDLVVTAGYRGVFPQLPPGVRALPAAGLVSRFEGDRGPRLLAQLETPGTPAESLWATCVVIDSTDGEIARASRELSPSGCDPTELRTADFAFDVPPGPCRVAFSVQDGHGGRGVLRSTARVEPASSALALSDIVVTCGPLEALRKAAEVRLMPNVRARVAGDDPLIAYFEIYHLLPDEEGQAPFEYEYSVHSEEKVPRPWYRRLLPAGEPRLVYRSEEVNYGPLRRQFITVPMRSLPPGRCRLDVMVRDLNAGRTAKGSARFERVGVKPADR